MSTYKNNFEDADVKQLDKIKYLLHSIGKIPLDVNIDFEVDRIRSTGEIVGINVWIINEFDFFGTFSDLGDIIRRYNNGIREVFSKFGFDGDLNIKRGAKNNFSSDPMLHNIDYDGITTGLFKLTIEYYVEFD